jgi:hypothetical protein
LGINLRKITQINALFASNRGTRDIPREGQDPFQLPGLHFTRETAESMALNQISGGAKRVHIFGGEMPSLHQEYDL